MGRALTRDSATFLFDEPLSNLDAKLRGQMRAELALMRQRVHKNMVYVTHDQIEAMTLADRIVVMHSGHIQQQGTPEELFKRPVNKFVAGFLGTPPMNFLDAEVVDRDGAPGSSGKGFEFALDGDHAAAARAHPARSHHAGHPPVGSGVRRRGAQETAFELRVIVSEYIGAHSVLMCDCGGQQVVVELKSETPIPLGETLRLRSTRQGSTCSTRRARTRDLRSNSAKGRNHMLKTLKLAATGPCRFRGGAVGRTPMTTMPARRWS
jgi:multiple sugar transport system ATP-binding protein